MCILCVFYLFFSVVCVRDGIGTVQRCWAKTAPTQLLEARIFGTVFGLKFQVLFFVLHVEGGFKDVIVFCFFFGASQIVAGLQFDEQMLKPPTIKNRIYRLEFNGRGNRLKSHAQDLAQNPLDVHDFPSSVVGL